MICAVTILINLTSYAWNDHDMKTLERTKEQCGIIYKNSPCVSKFIKYGEKDYRVICSQEKQPAEG